MPWLTIVDSSATTARPAPSALATSGARSSSAGGDAGAEDAGAGEELGFMRPMMPGPGRPG
jgi:hypothetical protein